MKSINDIQLEIKSLHKDLEEISILSNKADDNFSIIFNIESENFSKCFILSRALENNILKINVGGGVFFSNVSKLLTIPNTFFSKLIITEFDGILKQIMLKYKESLINKQKTEIMDNIKETTDIQFTHIYQALINNSNEEFNLILNQMTEEYSSCQIEIFIDRSPKCFDLILNYLNNQTINMKSLSMLDKELLFQESQFYEIESLYKILDNRFKYQGEIRIKAFSTIYQNLSLPNNKITSIKQLTDHNNTTNHLVVNLNGSIIVNLDKKYDIKGVYLRIMDIKNSNIVTANLICNSIAIKADNFSRNFTLSKSILEYYFDLEVFNNGSRINTDTIYIICKHGTLAVNYINFD